MINNIMQKVGNMQRILERNVDDAAKNKKVMVISTYGRDNQLVNTVKDLQSKCETIQFQFVKKAAPSLNNILTKSKFTALGTPFGKIFSCPRERCLNCKLMSEKILLWPIPLQKFLKLPVVHAYPEC